MNNYQRNQDIADLIKRHNPIGVKILYESYSSILYGSILRIVKDTEAAEQVLQATIDKICKNIAQYQQDQFAFLTWIMQFARSLSIDYICVTNQNKIGDYNSHNEELRIPRSGAVELLMMPLTTRSIETEVCNMVFQGHRINEIAESLDLSIDEVRLNLRKGIKLKSNRG